MTLARDEGYGQAAKKDWRDEVWWHIARQTDRRARRHMRAFMLESLDGREIDKALHLGFQQKNLHVCNSNPAVVATLRRRYPDINTYGVVAERALIRCIESDNRLHVISLDFCGHIGSEDVTLPLSVVPLACKQKAALVAVNVMRGREHWTRKGGSGAALDRARLAEIHNLVLDGYSDHVDLELPLHVGWAVDLVASGMYRSRVVPMGWVVLRRRYVGSTDGQVNEVGVGWDGPIWSANSMSVGGQ